jgi:diguanylate cyclase (GGDEF)-like protein
MRFLILALIGFFLLNAAQAANSPLLTPDEQAWLREHPDPIRVHNELNWRPYNFNEAGEPKGYSIDYMNLVAEKLGIKIRYISGPSWSEFLEMMKNRSLDLMINIASTKDRRTYLGFSEPYLISSTSLYVRISDNSISDLDDLEGKKIAFTKGFFFGEFIRKYYPKIEIVTFDSTLASFIGVDKGLADAAIEVPVVAQRILREAKLTSLKRGGKVKDPRFITTFAFATRKDDQTLLNIIQKGMDAITSVEESSIRRKWKLEETELPLISADQRNYLKQLGQLRVCVNPERLPLEAVNLDGSLTGISSEFVNLLEERVKIPFHLVKTSNWVESLKFAAAGKCDLLPMAIKTPERQHYLNFTSAWLTLPYVVATRHDQIYISSINQVIGEQMGVVRGLASRENLVAAYPDIKLVEVDSVSDGLKKVDSGKLFGFIDTIPTISRTLQAEAITGVKISGDVGTDMSLAIAVNGKDRQLLEILESSLRAIEKDQITGIYNRWLAVAYIDRFDYTRFWLILTGIILITLYIYYRYRRGLLITAKLRAAHAEVEVANRELDRQARTDPLTGIANRLKTGENLSHELIRYQRYKEHFSVVMLDIDHFKRINDSSGHHVGDEVLKNVASLLTQKTRASDLPGRWGGEEFLIICPSTTHDGALKLAEILRLALQESGLDNLPPQTASFGVASIEDGESIDDLVKRADSALYQAKSAGRNCVVG